MKPRIVFMGTPDFAVPSLNALLEQGYPVVGVVCQPDKPTGRHQVLTAPPVKQVALAHNLPVLQPAKVRTGEFAKALRALKPDLIVTAAYGRILPADVLAIPAYGCLNVHGSLLPAYRGAAPVQWSIIDGLPETGVTIMKMDEGMDTGDILLQGVYPISDWLDAGQLMDELAKLGASLLPEAIEGVIKGTLCAIPQQHEKATYAALVNRQTGAIDWTLPAKNIHNLIRGTYPWPGAWTILPDGKRLKIHRAQLTRSEIANPLSARPGTLISARPDGITIQCGDGTLDLLEIQPEGGKRMNSAECSHNYIPGTYLGGSL